jgi:hypothetical protein
MGQADKGAACGEPPSRPRLGGPLSRGSGRGRGTLRREDRSGQLSFEPVTTSGYASRWCRRRSGGRAF